MASLDSTVGALFIGVVGGIFFYACTCAQTVYYFHYYADDGKWNKRIVMLLWLLDTTNTIFATELLGHYSVSGHNNLEQLSHITGILAVEFMNGTIVIIIGQLCFMYKVFMLQSRGLMRTLSAGFMIILCVVSFAAGIASCVKAETVPGDPLLGGVLAAWTPAILQNAIFVASDIYITLALCLLLENHRTGMARTNSLITTLVVFAINRGILSTIFQLCHVLTFALSRGDTLVWTVFHIIGSKVYVNAYLGSQNARRSLTINQGTTLEKYSSIQINRTPSLSNTRRPFHNIKLNAGPILDDPQIQINTTVTTDVHVDSHRDDKGDVILDV